MLAVTEPTESWAGASSLLDIEDVEFVWFRERGAGVQRVAQFLKLQFVRHHTSIEASSINSGCLLSSREKQASQTYLISGPQTVRTFTRRVAASMQSFDLSQIAIFLRQSYALRRNRLTVYPTLSLDFLQNQNEEVGCLVRRDVYDRPNHTPS